LVICWLRVSVPFCMALISHPCFPKRARIRSRLSCSLRGSVFSCTPPVTISTINISLRTQKTTSLSACCEVLSIGLFARNEPILALYFGHHCHICLRTSINSCHLQLS